MVQRRSIPVCVLGIGVDAAEPLSPLTADRLRLRRVIKIRTHILKRFFYSRVWSKAVVLGCQ
jgi:hypothetical protein